jgi:hypothetical protein
VETFQDILDFTEAYGFSRQVPADTLKCWLRAFARVSEPKTEYKAELIILSSTGGGVSRKPGNILLNWRRLFDVTPDAAIAVSAYGVSPPFVRGMIGLYIWNKVWRGSEEQLSEIESSIIETLWVRHGRARQLPEDTAFDSVNESRHAAGLSTLSKRDFTRATDRLVTMSCVELKDGNIWLREWVRRAT